MSNIKLDIHVQKIFVKKTNFRFSLLSFQRILNAFLYDLYQHIAHILTFLYRTQYIYTNRNAIRVIKSA